MTANILPELMRDSAASVRRAADRLAGGEIGPEDFAALVRYCRCTLRESWRVRRATEAVVRQGSEAGEFRRRCELDLASLDEAAAAAAQVRQRAVRVPPSKRRDAALARLEWVEKGLASVRRAYDEYMEVLNRPPRPVDPKRLEESRAAYERGEHVWAADVWARIQAGQEEP